MTPRDWLVSCGADQVAHPGGSLLSHLERVADRLASYGASESLVVAGLVHVAYSTDGYDTALLAPDERDVLRDVVGEEAEELAWLFGAADQRRLWAQVAEPLVVWVDRFNGAMRTLDPAQVAPLVELAVANELDGVEVIPGVREEHGHALLRVFTRARPLLSDATWADVQRTLG